MKDSENFPEIEEIKVFFDKLFFSPVKFAKMHAAPKKYSAQKQSSVQTIYP